MSIGRNNQPYLLRALNARNDLGRSEIHKTGCKTGYKNFHLIDMTFHPTSVASLANRTAPR